MDSEVGGLSGESEHGKGCSGFHPSPPICLQQALAQHLPMAVRVTIGHYQDYSKFYASLGSTVSQLEKTVFFSRSHRQLPQLLQRYWLSPALSFTFEMPWPWLNLCVQKCSVALCSSQAWERMERDYLSPKVEFWERARKGRKWGKVRKETGACGHGLAECQPRLPAGLVTRPRIWQHPHGPPNTRSWRSPRAVGSPALMGLPFWVQHRSDQTAQQHPQGSAEAWLPQRPAHLALEGVTLPCPAPWAVGGIWATNSQHLVPWGLSGLPKGC